jgi:hypothetical protein
MDGGGGAETFAMSLTVALGLSDVFFAVFSMHVLYRSGDKHRGSISVLQCVSAGIMGGAALGHLTVLDTVVQRSAFGVGLTLALLMNAIPQWVEGAQRVRDILRVLREAERENSSASHGPYAYELSPSAQAAQRECARGEDVLNATDIEWRRRTTLTRQRQTNTTFFVLLIASCFDAWLTALAFYNGQTSIWPVVLITDCAQALALVSHGRQLRPFTLLLCMSVWAASTPVSYLCIATVFAPRLDVITVSNIIAGIYVYVSLVDTLAHEVHAGFSPLQTELYDGQTLPYLLSPFSYVASTVQDRLYRTRTAVFVDYALLVARPLMFALMFAMTFWF